MPIAATTQSVAAVVRPRTDRPCRMIAPAPRKPMPLTICAAMRDGSRRTTVFGSCERTSWNPNADTIVNSAEPSETSRCVRSPASRTRNSRSRPITEPSAAARARRPSESFQGSSGRVLAQSDVDRLLLVRRELVDARCGEVEQLVEPLPVERHPLGRRLHLDEAAVAGHDDVDIDLGIGILGVVEVEERDAVD